MRETVFLLAILVTSAPAAQPPNPRIECDAFMLERARERIATFRSLPDMDSRNLGLRFRELQVDFCVALAELAIRSGVKMHFVALVVKAVG